MTTNKKVEEVEFDIDQCIDVNVNYDTLKLILKYLLKRDKEHKAATEKLNNLLQLKQISIDQ